jgi:pimeloyl-ACP methyl ester carboxylesterase
LAGKSPGVVFLGGLMSDMAGTKAQTLEAHCAKSGRAFTRFDYSGHGQSSGKFIDGTIGRWHADTLAVLDQVTEGPQILIGSSMGGWQMLLAARARPERIAGMIGIAAAPDFTEDLMWKELTEDQRRRLREDGILNLPSDYGDEPYPISLALIEEGREQLLLRGPLPIRCPTHLLQGMQDADVPWRTSLRIAEALESEEVIVTLVKDGDHRLSRDADLDRLCAALDDMIGCLAA